MSFGSLNDVRIVDASWSGVQELIQRVVLPYQWEILNDRVADAHKSYAMRNFSIAAGLLTGTHGGAVFQDSDVYKWLEAVSYSLPIKRDETLERCADEAIALLGKAQQADGYLNTFYTIAKPDERFKNLTEGHELYCAGHLFEAAVAYFEATGKRELLNIATRLADCLVRHFMPETGENRGYPGHPEVELALIRLHGATGRGAYLDLAERFLNVRGTGEPWRDVELGRGGFTRISNDMFEFPLDYFQEHEPVRKQTQATGHAVRAMYLYSAMADMAKLKGDTELQAACARLYKNTTEKQMYVTGGIGSCAIGERFTADYDLPNDAVYAETCASVGLMMFSLRMWRLTRDKVCFDIWEKALYNTVLAGMGQDGQHFFYVNPLSVDPEVIARNPALQHVQTERPRWFGVSCCPPNLARCVLSMGKWLYADEDDGFYVLSHIDSELKRDGLTASLSHTGERYTLSVNMKAGKIRLRVPDGFMLTSESGKVENGYLVVDHLGGEDTVHYCLTPIIRVLHAHPRIAHCAKKVCVAYGQSVYCLEEADNGPGLCALMIKKNPAFEKVTVKGLKSGTVALRTQGQRLLEDTFEGIYSESEPKRADATLTFIPYRDWNNRGRGEMTVWINQAD